jgi:hypothetical protein
MELILEIIWTLAIIAIFVSQRHFGGVKIVYI